ncbi:MAG: class I SAM-dependent methyltransferase, partial [Burkholderiaceae bacterium]
MGSPSSVRSAEAPRLPAPRWPLPALLAWGAAWLAMTASMRSDVAPPLAIAVGVAVGAAPAVAAASFWRRAIVAGGFPLSLIGSGLGAALPAWAWLIPLAALAL